MTPLSSVRRKALRRFAYMLIGVAALTGVAAPTGSLAQIVQSIVAVVNDDVITSFDLDQRIRILLLTSGLSDSIDQRRQLEQRVLQTLIDERLKMQEAERRGIDVTSDEFASAMESLERSNNMQPGGMADLAHSNNIDPSAMETQILADLTWQKLLIQTENDNVVVETQVIDEALSRIESSEGQTEYRVVELLLLADERAGVPKEDARLLADRLVGQIRDGTGFASIATQFSDSATAQRGGDLGWMLAEEMPAAMAATVPDLAVGRVTDPIEEERGYRVYGLLERRLANTTVDANTQVAVRIYVIRMPESANQAAFDQKFEEAQQIRRSISSCDDFKRRAEAAGTPQPPSPTRLSFGQMNPRIRTILASLAPGQISDPLPNPVGIQLIMVCDRELTSNLPSRAEVRQELLLERMESVSQRKLRDLRRAAFIDIRG